MVNWLEEQLEEGSSVIRLDGDLLDTISTVKHGSGCITLQDENLAKQRENPGT